MGLREYLEAEIQKADGDAHAQARRKNPRGIRRGAYRVRLLKGLLAELDELRTAAQPFAENVPEDYHAPCHSGICNARTCGRCGRAHRLHCALERVDG